MEQVTQAVNDELVASLDYKLATGNTNYIGAIFSEFPEHFFSEHVAGMLHPHHVGHGFRRSRVRKVGVYLQKYGRLQRHAVRVARPELFH